MAHHLYEVEPHKRKRDLDDNGNQPPHPEHIPQPPSAPPGNSAPVNYFTKSQPTKLELVQADGETFSDILGLINDYEGILNRQESLAANLGAKLTGPRVLRAVERTFEGTITTSPPQSPSTPNAVGWLDIITFAKTNPHDFALDSGPGGARTCQFHLKGVRVEISEDDWRLIISGGPNRMLPSEPFQDDEYAELATLDIVEKRLQALIKRADEVAKRSRQVNYQLGLRKAAIVARQSLQQVSAAGFHGAAPSWQATVTSPRFDLHADLLQQFQSDAPPTSHAGQGGGLANSTLPTQIQSGPPGGKPASHRKSSQGHRQSSGQPSDMENRDSTPEDPSAMYRPLIAARVEKLGKGARIYPPCDRCRRLKTDCIKHLTACQGCTKKHARCAWKSVSEDELAYIRNHSGVADGDVDGDGDSEGNSQTGPASIHQTTPLDGARTVDEVASAEPSHGDRYRPTDWGDAARQSLSLINNISEPHMDLDTPFRQSFGGPNVRRSSLPLGAPRDHAIILSHIPSPPPAAEHAQDGPAHASRRRGH